MPRPGPGRRRKHAPAGRLRFLAQWSGKSALDLLDRTRRTMPTDNPGGLGTRAVCRHRGVRALRQPLPCRAPPNSAAPRSGRSPDALPNGATTAATPRSTKYSPLDQINASNVSKLHIAWSWNARNFGRRAEFNWEVTPLMVGGRLFFTAGTRRDAVAIDAATGETLWMYRLDEGARGETVARRNNRGLAYWSDGRDERILLISPGYQLIALDARTGRPIPAFGKDGIVDLWEGLDRAVVKPGQIGSCSPAIVVRDVVVVGAALQAGTAPRSKNNVPGYIRGYDVRTGKRLWTFRTIPQPGEFGNETWENGSWKFTGNTGAWGPLSADEELGYVYVPVETPTGDFYGGHRPGDNLFGESLVCLDARTGKRVWHFQLVHHGVWDWDPPTAPTLLDITVGGRRIKAVAQITKQAWVYVFDRVTGKPVWPIEERPVPQSDVPGERTSPTQPFPTKPAAFDRQGITLGRPDRLHARIEGRGPQDRVAIPARVRCSRRPRWPAPTARLATITLALAHRRRQLAGRRGRPGDRHSLRLLGDLRRAVSLAPRPDPHRHGLRRPVRFKRHRAAGAAAGQTAMGPHHRHRPQHRRARLDGPQRQHAGIRQAPSRAEGHRPQPYRQPGARADSGDQDAALHRRWRRHVRHAARAPAGRCSARSTSAPAKCSTK